MDNKFDTAKFVDNIINKAIAKENQRLYQKEYREKNKQKAKEYQKEYKKINKNKLKQYYKVYQKQYREKNKDKLKEQKKEYHQTPEYKKLSRISGWKKQGIITNDYDALYDHYLKTSYCDFCKIELTYDKKRTATTKCLDHDHSITDRPNFRNILCHSCNTKRR